MSAYPKYPSARKWSPNPSRRQGQTDDNMLKKIAMNAPSFAYRKNLQKLGGIDGLSPDLGVCWMCWVRITGEGLSNWRRAPFAENLQHSEICPLCGYDRWQGLVWFPKRYLMATEVGNPSRRDNKMS